MRTSSWYTINTRDRGQVVPSERELKGIRTGPYGPDLNPKLRPPQRGLSERNLPTETPRGGEGAPTPGSTVKLPLVPPTWLELTPGFFFFRSNHLQVDC